MNASATCYESMAASYPGPDGTPLRREYQYEYLSAQRAEIRLFYLDSVQHPEFDITGSLVTVSIHENQESKGTIPNYVALSYAWGIVQEDGSHLTESILCDGEILKVTANLKDALIRIRDHAPPYVLESMGLTARLSLGVTHIGALPLWIDAICINQASTRERSKQVQMMARIFGLSSCLLIWLGSPAYGHGESDQASLLRTLRGTQYGP